MPNSNWLYGHLKLNIYILVVFIAIEFNPFPEDRGGEEGVLLLHGQVEKKFSSSSGKGVLFLLGQKRRSSPPSRVGEEGVLLLLGQGEKKFSSSQGRERRSFPPPWVEGEGILLLGKGEKDLSPSRGRGRRKKGRKERLRTDESLSPYPSKLGSLLPPIQTRKRINSLGWIICSYHISLYYQGFYRCLFIHVFLLSTVRTCFVNHRYLIGRYRMG